MLVEGTDSRHREFESFSGVQMDPFDALRRQVRRRRNIRDYSRLISKLEVSESDIHACYLKLLSDYSKYPDVTDYIRNCI